MFVFVSDVMKKIVAKISFVVCLLSMVALLFTACSEKDIYAENSDFESYPDYWNSFNQNTTGDDLYIVDPSDKTTTAGVIPLKVVLIKVLQVIHHLKSKIGLLILLMMKITMITVMITAISVIVER